MTSDIAVFQGSMPITYGSVFSESDMVEHCRIVSARGTARCRVELWRKLPGSVTILCVVADDSAGLLSVLSSTFVSLGLTITAAQIYSRRVQGRPPEAVDFFWVRPLGEEDPFAGQPLGSLAELSTLLDGRLLGYGSEPLPSTQRSPRHGDPTGGILVYFDAEELAKGRNVLVVAAPDAPGLLLTITVALVRARVEIDESDIRTEDGRALDRFVITAEPGGNLDDQGRLSVERAVQDSLERMFRNSAS